MLRRASGGGGESESRDKRQALAVREAFSPNVSAGQQG